MKESHGSSPPGNDLYEQIALDLEEKGWSVTPRFISPGLMTQLAEEARRDWSAGEFRPAGVGRGEELVVRPEIRSDHVNWIDSNDCSPALSSYLQQLEQLRQAINSRLYLGLFDFEGHLAVYPPSSYYRRHLDQFRNVGLRTVSTVLYLNEDWHANDGGQLRLFSDPDDPQAYEEILPIGGRLVTFLSADFEHEVRPARRERLSLTGWFKIRGVDTD